MKKLTFAILVVVLIIAAGCIKPVTKLGCCLKDNIEDGCVLYNTTDFLEYDYTGSTIGECDNEEQDTTDNCKVDIEGTEYLIPICTQDDLVTCIAPECTAMVCGDYKYTPRVAPGFISVEDSSGDIPPDTEEGITTQFYKAQCRFLPMDAKLRQVMKNSKSAINVFRMGVGGSFNEYDQYKYYFPMSDKFCNINPPRSEDDLRVDRYMNYIGADRLEFDPISDIDENCLDDSDIPAPFEFSESSGERSSTLPEVGDITYDTLMPDQSSYNLSHHGNVDYQAEWVADDGGFYTYSDEYFNPESVYKELDIGFYKRNLAVAHARDIYGIGGETTRAPFECDAGKSECYSGNCDVSIYNRGVFVRYSADEGETLTEVVVDCNKITDVNGRTRIVCAPTTNIIQPNPTMPPTIDYAEVDVGFAHVEGGRNPLYELEDFMDDDKMEELEGYWNEFTDSDWVTGPRSTVFSTRNISHTPYNIDTYLTQRRDCPQDYGENDGEDFVVCSMVDESTYQPPIGGAVFFGRIGQDTVTYMGDTIIGYAIASPDEFEDMYVVKNCDMDHTSTFSLPEQDGSWECDTGCADTCAPAYDDDEGDVLAEECSAYCTATGPAPCSAADTGTINTDDYIRLQINSQGDQTWDTLMEAFAPYFLDNVEGMTQNGFSDGCGGIMNVYDPIIASIPWVVSYSKGVTDIFSWEGRRSLFVSSLAPQSLSERNAYDWIMENDWKDTSSCELRRSWIYTLAFGDYETEYNMLFSKYIYLFKYNPTSGRIGSCAVDDATYLPTMKTYGWCNPCTTSTLAYQEIKAEDDVYMPGITANIQDSEYRNEELICDAEYSADWSWSDGTEVSDSVSCYNPHITDIDEYMDSIGSKGSPRTAPDAAVMKMRLGNYMKSGVMPVLDISNETNWNLKNPDYEEYGWFYSLFYTEASDEYLDYDFEKLFGNMGATVVIVDHIKGEATAEDIEQIAQRSAIVRSKCVGCLVAFHVDNPLTNESFRDSVVSVLADPRIYFNIDLVTFDYRASERPVIFFGGNAIAEDLESYGRIALQTKGKPTMVVGFNLENYPVFDRADYENIFVNMILKQDDFIKSGIIGIIYSPVRTTDESGSGSTGLVDVDAGVGIKDEKFCAFQQAMGMMSASPPMAMFAEIPALTSINCTRCNSLEVETPGSCEMTCENGELCTLPDSVEAGVQYKCPDNTILEPCRLCNEIPGNYVCTKTYLNSTTETISGSMADVGSELYLDVVGGLSKPDKCCLLDETTGITYSYSKKSSIHPINKPIVFPKTGDPNADCSIGGDFSDIQTISSFCGMQVVNIREYDINCTIID